MLARPASDGEVDSESNAFRIILSEINRLSIGEFKIGTLLDVLFKRKKDEFGNFVRDGMDDLREAVLELCPVGKQANFPDSKTFGKRLGRFRGRVMDGLKIVTNPGHGGVMKWKVVSIQ